MAVIGRRIVADRGVGLVQSPVPRGRATVSGLAAAAVTKVARAATRFLLADGGVLDPLAALRADPRQAVQEDSICCLVCGRVFRQLTNTHLRGHDISAPEYKRRFGYNRGRPLMCRALQRLYVERAVRSGLAGRIRRRPILFEPELRRLGGCRAIALEEMLTRREARRRAGQWGGAVEATTR